MMLNRQEIYKCNGLGALSKYAYFGEFESLLSKLSHFRGIKKYLEIIWLKALSYKKNKELYLFPEIQSFELSNILKKYKAGFFFDTSWYKNSILSGLLLDKEGKIYFFKMFKEKSMKNQEYARTLKFSRSAKDQFRCAEIVDEGEIYLIMEYIKKEKDCREEIAIRNILKYHLDMDKLPCVLDEHLDIKNIQEKLPLIYEAGSRIINLVPKLKDKSLTLSESHGDYTFSNMYMDCQGNHVLIDYERSGLRVSYGDLCHFFFQQNLGGNVENNITSIENILAQSNLKLETIRRIIGVYLLEELSLDVNDWCSGYQYSQLKKLIIRKCDAFLNLFV